MARARKQERMARGIQPISRFIIKGANIFIPPRDHQNFRSVFRGQYLQHEAAINIVQKPKKMAIVDSLACALGFAESTSSDFQMGF